jgi:hypothetical protein
MELRNPGFRSPHDRGAGNPSAVRGNRRERRHTMARPTSVAAVWNGALAPGHARPRRRSQIVPPRPRFDALRRMFSTVTIDLVGGRRVP